MALTDRDLTIAIVIAVVIILVALVGWPGYLRLSSRSLGGFWASSAGSLYEVRPTGSRRFELRASSPGDEGLPPIRGRVVGVRGLELAPGPWPGRRGKMEIGGRRIEWEGGGVWSRQGVPQKFAVGQTTHG